MMENIDFDSGRLMGEMQKCLATLYTLSRYIPAFAELQEEYGPEEWNLDDDAEDFPVLRKALRRTLDEWYANTSPAEIVKTLTPFKYNPKLRPVLIHLRNWSRPKYKHYLESDHKGLPNDFAAPCPFLVMSDRRSNTSITKPVELTYGRTKIEVRNSLLRAEDGQLTVALLLLMRRSDCVVTEKTISFTTTREEIARTLDISNPWCETTRNRIWGGLTRLNDCRMTLTNAKGLRTLGGILSGARELEEDSDFQLRIHLDRDFITLFDEGYVALEPEIYFRLRPTLANLYLFLQRQRSFSEYGTLNPISIFKIYEYAGLGGIDPASKEDWYKRRIIKNSFSALAARRIITNRVVFTGDTVQIITIKSNE